MLHLVINLDRSPNRWTSIKKELSRFDIVPQRIVAIDANNLTDNEIKELTPSDYSLIKTEFPMVLRKTEYACFLSHKKCWQTLADSKEDWALIFEDDVCISDKAKEVLSNIDWIPKGIGLVQIFNVRKEQVVLAKKKTIKLDNGNELIRQTRPTPVGALAYFISKQYAIEAIKASKKISQPSDEFLFSPFSKFARNHPSYKLLKSVVSTFDYESTIGENNRNQKRIKIKFARNNPIRLFYRLKFILSYKMFCKKIKIIYH